MCSNAQSPVRKGFSRTPPAHSRTPSVLQGQPHERARGQRWRCGEKGSKLASRWVVMCVCERERERGCRCPFSFSLPAVFTCLYYGARQASLFFFSPLSARQPVDCLLTRSRFSSYLWSAVNTARSLPLPFPLDRCLADCLAAPISDPPARQ
jgi:hypothetical protein